MFMDVTTNPTRVARASSYGNDKNTPTYLSLSPRETNEAEKVKNTVPKAESIRHSKFIELCEGFEQLSSKSNSPRIGKATSSPDLRRELQQNKGARHTTASIAPLKINNIRETPEIDTSRQPDLSRHGSSIQQRKEEKKKILPLKKIHTQSLSFASLPEHIRIEVPVLPFSERKISSSCSADEQQPSAKSTYQYVITGKRLSNSSSPLPTKEDSPRNLWMTQFDALLKEEYGEKLLKRDSDTFRLQSGIDAKKIVVWSRYNAKDTEERAAAIKDLKFCIQYLSSSFADGTGRITYYPSSNLKNEGSQIASLASNSLTASDSFSPSPQGLSILAPSKLASTSLIDEKGEEQKPLLLEEKIESPKPQVEEKKKITNPISDIVSMLINSRYAEKLIQKDEELKKEALTLSAKIIFSDFIKKLRSISLPVFGLKQSSDEIIKWISDFQKNKYRTLVGQKKSKSQTSVCSDDFFEAFYVEPVLENVATSDKKQIKESMASSFSKKKPSVHLQESNTIVDAEINLHYFHDLFKNAVLEYDKFIKDPIDRLKTTSSPSKIKNSSPRNKKKKRSGSLIQEKNERKLFYDQVMIRLKLIFNCVNRVTQTPALFLQLADRTRKILLEKNIIDIVVYNSIGYEYALFNAFKWDNSNGAQWSEKWMELSKFLRTIADYTKVKPNDTPRK